MILLPAIDLYEGKAVRLLRGDYAQMTVYSDDPLSVAADFKSRGAKWAHIVDLEGAREGATPNFPLVSRIAKESGLMIEVGGGLRNEDALKRYLDAGVSRLILGTAALRDRAFLERAVLNYGEKIAVGVDIRDGVVQISGWTESGGAAAFDFCGTLEKIGVQTIIVTDVSRDGAMRGTNRGLYRDLSARFKMNVIASGGVSSLEDITALRDMGLYGAIIGKAYYSGAIDLKAALEAAG